MGVGLGEGGTPHSEFKAIRMFWGTAEGIGR